MAILDFLQENVFWGPVALWLVASYVLWQIYRKDHSEKNSFDITMFGTLIVLFLHRVLHIILFPQNYHSNYWSWNPVAWIGGEKVFLGSKPWVAFAVGYSDFDLRILLVCCLGVLFFISRMQSIRFKEIVNKFFRVMLAIVPIFMLLSYFKNYIVGHTASLFLAISYGGVDDSRHPIQIYIFLLWIVLLISSNFLRKKYERFEIIDGLAGSFIMLVGSALILKYLAYNISSFVVNWLAVVATMSLGFGVLILLAEKFGGDKKQEVVSRINRFTPFNNKNLNKPRKRWKQKK